MLKKCLLLFVLVSSLGFSHNTESSGGPTMMDQLPSSFKKKGEYAVFPQYILLGNR